MKPSTCKCNLRFVHFIVYKLTFKEKLVNKYWTLANEMGVEVLRVHVVMCAVDFKMHLKVRVLIAY